MTQKKTPNLGTVGKVTIKDVADHLGISHSTVSRALTGQGRISPEVRQMVRDASQKLGYVANAGARILRGAQSTIIGFLVPDISNAFYAKATNILADRCADAGCELMLAVSDEDPRRELRHIEAFREARAKAILITPTAGLREETLQLLGGTTVIQFVREHPGLQAPVVSVDDMAGTRLATLHLLDQGHTRIAFIGGGENLSTGLARLNGFRQAFTEKGLEPDPALISLGKPVPEFGTMSIARLLDGGPVPSAVVLGSSNLIVGVMQVVHQRALEIPADISLIGYGDPDWLSAWRPGITTIGFSVEKMVNVAASLMFRQTGVEERNAPNTTHFRFRIQPQLLVRGSTAPVQVFN